MYTLISNDGSARRGRFVTDRGVIETPQFMPVGTRGTVKGLNIETFEATLASIMLVNTYHLWLRPGPQIVENLGGIHQFTGWNGPILSDSGGFQVYSLSNIRSLSEEGVTFRSHLDGSKQFLSPEGSIGIQNQLGVDIAMAFDECPPGDVSYEDAEKSLALTHRWAERCLSVERKKTVNLFGITQGVMFPELRAHSADFLAKLPFDGYAIGGLSVGEAKDKMYGVLDYHPEQLPAEKVRYLMGVGTPQDIVYAVSKGVDLFDCVMPTRCGRFGRVFINDPEVPYINIKNASFAESKEPLDASCNLVCCRRYSRGYINHLFKVKEMLGPQLVSLHNLGHYLNLMKEIREAIASKTFERVFKRVMNQWRGIYEVE